MMEKIKNAMKNGLVKGSCDSFGATSVGSSSERSRSGSDEARTATGRAGRAGRAVGGARGGAKAAAEPASRANVTFMLPAKERRVDGVRATAIDGVRYRDPTFPLVASTASTATTIFQIVQPTTDEAMRDDCGALLDEY